MIAASVLEIRKASLGWIMPNPEAIGRVSLNPLKKAFSYEREQGTGNGQQGKQSYPQGGASLRSDRDLRELALGFQPTLRYKDSFTHKGRGFKPCFRANFPSVTCSLLRVPAPLAQSLVEKGLCELKISSCL
ncbi:hypothetical protein [Calothrix anomala]|uniref:Uncharacterized protein n=2 Tax=Calothrix TaxID=1186 RepID=A0ABR8ALU5_9CYAN|nr:hypothetical protein [Calothrix parietina FACHB-288]MBD2229669.1 hypothetical protein [Calothrix anomala FACHB-343]